MCSESLKAVKSLKVLNGITKKARLDVELKKKRNSMCWSRCSETLHIQHIILAASLALLSLLISNSRLSPHTV